MQTLFDRLARLSARGIIENLDQKLISWPLDFTSALYHVRADVRLVEHRQLNDDGWILSLVALQLEIVEPFESAFARYIPPIECNIAVKESVRSDERREKGKHADGELHARRNPKKTHSGDALADDICSLVRAHPRLLSPLRIGNDFMQHFSLR